MRLLLYISTYLLSVLGLLAQDLDSFPRKLVPAVPELRTKALSPELLESSITNGVDYLLSSQNSDGSWGNARRTKNLNIYAPAPGAHHAYRMGSTCLAFMGLMSANDGRPEVAAAIQKCEEWLMVSLPRLRRAEGTTIYNNWGHAYGLRSLCALARREGVTAEKLQQYKTLAEGQLKQLKLNQDLDGGWGYLALGSMTAQPSDGSTSFTTATVLLALKEAADTFGVHYEKRLLDKAIASIHRQRNPDFTYLYAPDYWKAPRASINRPAGSLARTPACNVATRVWGDEKITDEVLEMGLDRLVKRNGWLDIGRKRPVPHDIHFSISGYFYYYGHYYASECITILPAENQAIWKNKLARIILDKQESDGSWWDYPLYNYHQSYGTGYALVTLSRCRLKK